MKKIKNAWNKLKINTRKKWKRIKNEHLIKEYINNNTLFLTFVLVTVLDATLLRFFCMRSIENYLSWKAIIADTFIAVFIGSFGYLFKPGKRFFYYLFFSIFLTAICVINSAYYTFYTSFASISMLSLTQYIGDVGDAVVENVLQIKDIVYIIAPICICIAGIKLRKKNYFKHVELKSDRRKMTVKNLLASGVILLLFIMSLSSLDVSRFMKQWNK